MKLLLWHQYDAARLNVLTQRLDDVWDVELWKPADGDQALADLRERADAIVSMYWTKAYLPANNLKLIHLPGAGLDAIDFAVVPAGCVVCNVYEHEIGIAEFLVASILDWEIGLSRMQRAMRRGDWRGSFVLNDGTHGELFGKTVGIVGYGRIGREAAKRLRSFGVRVMARTRTPDKTDENVDDIGPIADLDSLLRESDYVIIACPLNENTGGLIDRRAFSLMRDTAVVINVGRGPVIDEAALYEACRDNTIGGAIIDTWYQYPNTADDAVWPSKFAFQILDNVRMTPHTSGWSAGLFPRRWSVIADNLNRLANGETLINQVTSSQ